MIQIQRPEQFTRAAERLAQERMRVSQHEPRLYAVTNTAKGHTYHVRISRRLGKAFGTCTCEAGTPSDRGRVPMVCKHLLAAVIFHRALYAMRRAAVEHRGDDERQRAELAAVLVSMPRVAERAGGFAI